MTMSRESMRQQMQEQRPSRKRQLYEVAPSPPKRLKKLASSSDSPSSSPSKDPLVVNSDDESPRFRTKSFYGSKKKLVLTKLAADAENSVSPLAHASPTTTRMSRKMNRDKMIDGKTSKNRVALSPIKNVYGNDTAKRPKKKPVSKNGVNRRQGKSVPSKTKVNVDTKLPRAPQKLPDRECDEEATPDKTRKFFKHKSPGSASKTSGGVVVGKNFNLRFVPRSQKGHTQATPKRTGASAKQQSNAKTKKRQYKNAPEIKSAVQRKSQGSSSGRTPDQNGMTRMETTTKRETKNGKATDLNSFLGKKNTIQRQPEQSRSDRRVSDDSSFFEESIPISSSMSDELLGAEPESLGSENLSSFDSQSLLSDISGPDIHSPSSISTQRSEWSPAEEKHHGKFYSIFSKKRHSLRQTAAESSSSGTIVSTPKDSPMTKKFIDPKGDNSQLILDAGQKEIGATHCKKCNMTYSAGVATDEVEHHKFHSAVAALKFTGWKKERVIKDFLDDGSRIILVLPDDQRFMVKKLEEVHHVMGKELGFPADQPFSFHGSYKAFLYISDEKRVEGCCFAELVTQGYRILPTSMEMSDSQRPWFCSPHPEPASVGIGRLWVYGPSRKRGIATRLLDCIRQWFEYGIIIPKSQLAFSDPTSDGRKFAARYTRTPHFLVYKYNH